MVSVAQTQYAARLERFALPRYGEIPRIELYMDQLLGYIEEMLGPLYAGNEKIITSSMVNNYVKQGILAAARSKKYTRDHIAYLIVICTLKQTFSIAEIEQLIASQIASFETAVAYDHRVLVEKAVSPPSKTPSAHCSAASEASLAALRGRRARAISKGISSRPRQPPSHTRSTSRRACWPWISPRSRTRRTPDSQGASTHSALRATAISYFSAGTGSPSIWAGGCPSKRSESVAARLNSSCLNPV